MSEPFIGQVNLFAGNFAPRGWALCDGQLLSISANTALFSILGTTYGGNGTTNFALPDLRGRVPVHPGSGPGLSSYVLGEIAGSENVSLTSAQLPAHTHSLYGTSANGTSASPAGAALASGLDSQSGTSLDYVPGSASPQLAAMAPASIGLTGGSQPVPVVQPLLCLNFIIALQGIFPSRN